MASLGLRRVHSQEFPYRHHELIFQLSEVIYFLIADLHPVAVGIQEDQKCNHGHTPNKNRVLPLVLRPQQLSEREPQKHKADQHGNVHEY